MTSRIVWLPQDATTEELAEALDNSGSSFASRSWSEYLIGLQDYGSKTPFKDLREAAEDVGISIRMTGRRHR